MDAHRKPVTGYSYYSQTYLQHMSTQYASQDMARTLQITTHTHTPRVVHIHTHTHTFLGIGTVRPAQRRHARASLWHDSWARTCMRHTSMHRCTSYGAVTACCWMHIFVRGSSATVGLPSTHKLPYFPPWLLATNTHAKIAATYYISASHLLIDCWPHHTKLQAAFCTNRVLEQRA
jgi:hypothetical protein